MSPTHRVALMAKYKLYISGGGSPEKCEDGHCQSSDKTRKRLKRKTAVVPPYGGGTFWVSAFRLRTSDGSRFEFGSCAGQPGQQTFNGRYTISCRFGQNLHHLPATCLGVVRLTLGKPTARQYSECPQDTHCLTCVHMCTPEHWTYRVAPSSPVVQTCLVMRGSVS